MLRIFGSKSGHPLADPKEAQRVLDSFSVMEPWIALEEAVAWFESLRADVSLRPAQRFGLTARVDEAVQLHARRSGREYLTSPRLGRAQELRLWRANREFWSELSRAYESCLDACLGQEKGSDELRPQLTLLITRLLRACATRLKWDQLRYGPIDSELWRRLGRAYLTAEQEGVAQRAVSVYPGSTGESGAQQEYLKALVFQSSSMDALMPLEIEIAERLIAHFLPDFVFTAEVRPDNVYWVDSAQPIPPTRLARLPQVSPTLRFFSMGSVLPKLADLQRLVEKGEVPADLNLGGQYSYRTILTVLRHLASYWAPRPPMRSFDRHRVKSRLGVVHGLSGVHARLTGRESQDPEAWIVEDVSQGGMGAQLPLGKDDWVRIGSLLGLQPEGGDNWLVGVVRRFNRDTEVQGSVGIETLAKTPRAIEGRIGGMRCEAVLLDAPGKEESVRVLLPPRAYENAIPVECELDGRRRRLQPLALIETGMDFDIGQYRLTDA